MILSEERITRFAHVIIDGVWEDDLVDYTDDDNALRAAKRGINLFCSQEGDLDEKVRAKLNSLKRTLVEGSAEWDTMYAKYYEEEMRKRG